MASRRTRVLVAMSGGVDSTLAAAILAADERYEPIGITLRLWTCGAGGEEAAVSCCGEDGAAAARAAAGALGIRHYVLDCRDTFRDEVLAPAWQDYAGGRTPNPCVLCNGEVKFKLLMDQASRLDAACMATGHYARVEPGEEGASPALLRGLDPNKDQSYFLFSLTTAQLAMTLFPLGALTKPEVRAEARRLSLPNAERTESQDACLGGGDVGFAEALRHMFDATVQEGELVDQEGRLLGRHQGVHHFTIGQRKGLGIATSQRSYVTAIQGEEGKVVISDVQGDLDAAELEAEGVSWLLAPGRSEEAMEVQIRYRHQAVPARVTWNGDDRVTVRFESPQRAVTPGQAVVFYRGERVLGGGWIKRAC